MISIVRQLEKKDMLDVAKVHIQCFPDSYSTVLGNDRDIFLMQAFYTEYIKDAPELFLVGENEQGRISGFCMGYYMERNGQMSAFFKHNLVRISLRTAALLLMGNRTAWSKVMNRFKKSSSWVYLNHEYDNLVAADCGDLLSICVLPEARGNGLAQQLMERYIEVMRRAGRKVCMLTVDIKNERAIRFYIRNGFVPYKEIPGQCRTYIKKL